MISIFPEMRRLCASGLRGSLGLALVGAISLSGSSDRSFYELFRERVPAVVALEYTIQYETEREQQEAVGLVLDEDGLLVFNEDAIPGWLPPTQFSEFRVFLPGVGGEGYEADYLGQDYRTQWHYVRVAAEVEEPLVPISRFGETRLFPGSAVWGIHLLSKEFDFEPAVVRGTVGLLREMPLMTGFAAEDIGVTGSAVFNEAGVFAGWLMPGIPQEKTLYMGRDSFNVGIQSTRGSTVFLDAREFLQRAGRVPRAVVGDRGPWMGVVGMQPLEGSVAEMMGLENQGAIVISDVIEGSPAQRAGLESRDIIILVDGETLPKFSPPTILIGYFEEQLVQKKAGETLKLSILSSPGDPPREVELVLDVAPRGLREAERQYFEGLGFSVREFMVVDGLSRRQLSMETEGVITNFVRPNSPADTGGLRRGDWIKEIDGVAVPDFPDARAALQEIGEDPERTEFVLLVDRQGETQVIRVQLN